MGKRKKYVIACLLVGIISLFFAKDVRAEKTKLEEWSKIVGYTVYDCGTKTEDGIFELQSDSSSLKKGEDIEVRILYYGGSPNVEGQIIGVYLDLFYDETVLEFEKAVLEDSVILEYGGTCHVNDYCATLEKGGWQHLMGNFSHSNKKIDRDICMFKVTFKVLQTTESTIVGLEPYDVVCGGDGTSITSGSGRYGNDQTAQEGEEIWQDRMTYTITDTPVTSSTLILSATPAQGSKEVTVPINIEKNDGFNLLGLTLNYDDSLFTYDSLEIDDSLKFKIGQESIYPVPDSGKVKASFIALEDIKDVGNFLKLKLKVKDGVPAGTTSNVGVEITQVGNKAETSMSGTGTTCTVSITDTSGGEEQQPVLGDVNADKKIDLVDAVYILQNYNQVREFTKAQETAADVTKDGAVNLVDALMIMKYFNEEITSF